MEATDYGTEAHQALNDNVSNWGPKLREMAEGVLFEVDQIDLEGEYPEDECAEIADSAVPVYNSDILETAGESMDLVTGEPGCGPAFDGSPTPLNIMAGNIYDLASNIAHQRLADRQNDAE